MSDAEAFEEVIRATQAHANGHQYCARLWDASEHVEKIAREWKRLKLKVAAENPMSDPMF